MSRNIIIVTNIFDDLSRTKQSIDSIRMASHRWGANFYELTNTQFINAPYPYLWEALNAISDCIKYDKVLVLDPDIVINSKAPNIFDELTDDYDFCAVLDGNPGGRFPNDDGLVRNSIVKNLSHNESCFQLFREIFSNFDYDKYWNNYCNMGVILFNSKKYNLLMDEMKSLILNNKNVYKLMMGDGFPFHSFQNFFNALISSSSLRVKLMGNEWNWTMPDIINEYNHEFFLGPMKPWIYHFTGTDGSKEELQRYDRWK